MIVRVLEKLTRFLGDKPAALSGSELRTPRVAGMQASVTEPWMTQLLGSLLPARTGVFLDIGVNLGQTLLKVKAIDPQRPYAGFEPNPACVFYLNELIAMNQIQEASIYPVALAEETGLLHLDLYNDSPADSAASIIPNFRSSKGQTRSLWVPAFRFADVNDALLQQSVAFIKIDVEGAELDVCRSLEARIRADRPVVLLEILPVYDEQNSVRLDRQLELESMFNSMGYRWFRIQKRPPNDFMGLMEIESIGIHGDLDACDYVLVSNDQSMMLDAIGQHSV